MTRSVHSFGGGRSESAELLPETDRLAAAQAPLKAGIVGGTIDMAQARV